MRAARSRNARRAALPRSPRSRRRSATCPTSTARGGSTRHDERHHAGARQQSQQDQLDAPQHFAGAQPAMASTHAIDKMTARVIDPNNLFASACSAHAVHVNMNMSAYMSMGCTAAEHAACSRCRCKHAQSRSRCRCRCRRRRQPRARPPAVPTAASRRIAACIALCIGMPVCSLCWAVSPPDRYDCIC